MGRRQASTGLLAGLGAAVAVACASPAPAPECPAGQLLDDAEQCVPSRCGPRAAGADDADRVLRPGDSLQDAADAVGDGVIFLADGVHPGPLLLDDRHDGLTIEGRCPELTSVVPSGNEEGALIETRGRGVELRGVTVRGGFFGIRSSRLLGRGGSLRLEDVEVVDSVQLGILSDSLGTETTLRNVVIRGTTGREDLDQNLAMVIVEAARVSGSNVRILDNHGVGLRVEDPSTRVELEDVVVRGGRCIGEGSCNGVSVLSESELVVDGLHIEDQSALSLRVEGGHATVTDAVVQDPVGARGQPGLGVDVSAGGSLEATRLEVRGAEVLAIGVRPSSEAVLVDTLVSGTRSVGSLFGTAIGITRGATARATGLRIEDGEGFALQQEGGEFVIDGLTLERHRGVGLAAIGGTLEVSNALMRETWPLPVPGFGVRGEAVSAGQQAQIVLRDSEIADAVGFAIFSTGSAARVELTDVLVRDVVASPDIASGFGIVAQSLGRVVGEGVEIRDTEGPAVWAIDGGRVDLDALRTFGGRFAAVAVTDAAFSTTGSELGDVAFHPSEGGTSGVFVRSGPRTDVELSASTVRGVPGPAVYVVGGEGAVQVRDLGVSETGLDDRLGGGVVGLEGTRPWSDAGRSGLLVEATVFDGLPGAAVVLDRSGASIGRPGAQPNTFGVGGDPVRRQRCADAPPVEVGDGSDLDITCRETISLGPMFDYQPILFEAIPFE